MYLGEALLHMWMDNEYRYGYLAKGVVLTEDELLKNAKFPITIGYRYNKDKPEIKEFTELTKKNNILYGQYGQGFDNDQFKEIFACLEKKHIFNWTELMEIEALSFTQKENRDIQIWISKFVTITDKE